MKVPNGLFLPDLDDAKKDICNFISQYLQEAGLEGVVLGLSGGIDSALTAALACEALGSESVKTFMMPVSAEKDQRNINDAKSVAENIGITTQLFEIGPAVDFYKSKMSLDRLSEANLTARLRMVVLYAEANQNDLLVLGTGNKSEIMAGYFTKYGDGAADILPIGDLYKTNIFNLTEFMRLPKFLLTKAPSAGLWPGQTDEGELGVTFDVLDTVLFMLYEQNAEEKEILEYGVSEQDLNRVKQLVRQSEHKRARVPLKNIKRSK
ncbi:MAG: NAD+ synthase [Candidatus Thorarchaeota archaeon]